MFVRTTIEEGNWKPFLADVDIVIYGPSRQRYHHFPMKRVSLNPNGNRYIYANGTLPFYYAYDVYLKYTPSEGFEAPAEGIKFGPIWFGVHEYETNFVHFYCLKNATDGMAKAGETYDTTELRVTEWPILPFSCP